MLCIYFQSKEKFSYSIRLTFQTIFQIFLTMKDVIDPTKDKFIELLNIKEILDEFEISKHHYGANIKK